MSGKRTGKRSKAARANIGIDVRHRSGRTDWERLGAMTDEEAEAGARADQDNPPADEAWLAAGRLVLPSPKQAISLRVDRDVLEWFRAQKGRY